MLIGVVLNYFIPERVFVYVTSVALVGSLWTWALIVIAHLGYRAAVERGEAAPVSFRMPGAPYTNWLVLIFLGMVAIFLGIDEGTRVAIYVAPIWFALLGLGYYFSRRPTFSRMTTGAGPTGRPAGGAGRGRGDGGASSDEASIAGFCLLCPRMPASAAPRGAAAVAAPPEATLAVTSLGLARFRSHLRARLELDARPVAVFGPNGAGKTNLIEAVSLLSPGRGLRGAASEELARVPEPAGWKVTAELASPDGRHEVATWSEGPGRRVEIDGKPASQTALGAVARVLWLTPAMDRLWLEGRASGGGSSTG